MKFASLAGIVLLALPLVAHAASTDGGSDRGGGDNDGIGFKTSLTEGLSKLSPGAISSDQMKKLQQILPQIRFIVVDQELPVALKGDPNTVQYSVATNEPSTLTVRINRARWNAIKSQGSRDQLAVHEALSLLGVESTGDYHISAAVGDVKYPALLGASGSYVATNADGCWDQVEVSADPDTGKVNFTYTSTQPSSCSVPKGNIWGDIIPYSSSGGVDLNPSSSPSVWESEAGPRLRVIPNGGGLQYTAFVPLDQYSFTRTIVYVKQGTTGSTSGSVGDCEQKIRDASEIIVEKQYGSADAKSLQFEQDKQGKLVEPFYTGDPSTRVYNATLLVYLESKGVVGIVVPISADFQGGRISGCKVDSSRSGQIYEFPGTQ